MACTGIELISKQGNPYWGRTQDFEQHFEYSGVKIPKGYNFSSMSSPFITQQAVMGIVWAKDLHKSPVLLDGINESGICGGSFYFDHFYRYVSTKEVKDSGKTPIRGEEICSWILTHYGSLDEIKEKLNQDVGVTNETGPMMGMSVPQHCVFVDETGRSIVVEPSVPNGFKIYENRLGVFTNAPTFDWQINNVKLWLERTTRRSYDYKMDEEIAPIAMDEATSGMVGIPADYKPESRFLRAAFAKLLSPTVSDNEALNQIFQLITTVNTPKGSLRIGGDKKTIYAWTQYTSGYDIRHKKLFAFTYDNRNLRELDWGDTADWGNQLSFFSFIAPQKTVPFIAKNSWKEGENTL